MELRGGRLAAPVGLAAALLLVAVISASFAHHCPEDELHHCGSIGHFVAGEAAVGLFLLILPSALACPLVARLRLRRPGSPASQPGTIVPARGPPSFPS